VTPADLKEHVWKSLGARKWLVGRKEVDRLSQLAIANWATERYQAGDMADATLVAMKNQHSQQYSMIWTLLLSAVASAVIQVILRWYLERRANRVMLMVWQQEGTT